MKLVVEIEKTADSDSIQQAISMIAGVLDVDNENKLVDDLKYAHEVMVDTGRILYRHADTSNPNCPLSSALDELQGYLVDNKVEERVDVVAKSPRDIMVFPAMG